jgi:putative addiction module component (TIGR02574 family)
MSIPVEVLEVEVLSLPPAERSRLLDRLLASLDPDPEWEEAWAQEVDRREAEITSGRATWLPGEEVVARLRAKLK